jgi:hypothetical protein
MDYGELLIREYVTRLEQKYSVDSLYRGSLERMGQIDLRSITEEVVEGIVEPFLYEWGRMGRVLGRPEFCDWHGNLAAQIRSNHQVLTDFRSKQLVEVNLDEFESDVRNCYDSFRQAVGQVASAKVLHLICPDFFPLWDNAIAKAVRTELVEKTNGRGIKDFSAADYYRFMRGIQTLLKRYGEVLLHLANQYGKRQLRIVDEFLWWATHRPLSLVV